MQHIHESGIVHGDLKPGNVLLKTHRADRRGYVAKVADFGLSRTVGHGGEGEGEGGQEGDDGAEAEAGSKGPSQDGGRGRGSGEYSRHGLGTIPYTAPEVFGGACPQKPADVYAFGILRECCGWVGRRARRHGPGVEGRGFDGRGTRAGTAGRPRACLPACRGPRQHTRRRKTPAAMGPAHNYTP